MISACCERCFRDFPSDSSGLHPAYKKPGSLGGNPAVLASSCLLEGISYSQHHTLVHQT
ncbi:hypothetical protein HMPREF3039_02016, partial [Akkermansia sp. KLE1798]